MYVASSWRAAQEELEVCLFPAVPQAAARTDKRLKEMRDGLKKVQGDDEPPRKKPAKKTWGVKLVLPRAASVVEHPGGSASDVASQDEGDLLDSTSSGSDVVPMCGYPDPAPAVPDDGPPPPPAAPDDGPSAAPRELRKQRFGRWTVSEVTRGGTRIGWGANCNCHHNHWQPAACKRQFLFAGNSDGDTLRIAKQWLLMGVPISNGDPMGKYKHLATIRRADIPLRTDEEMERDVAALE